MKEVNKIACVCIRGRILDWLLLLLLHYLSIWQTCDFKWKLECNNLLKQAFLIFPHSPVCVSCFSIRSPIFFFRSQISRQHAICVNACMPCQEDFIHSIAQMQLPRNLQCQRRSCVGILLCDAAATRRDMNCCRFYCVCVFAHCWLFTYECKGIVCRSIPANDSLCAFLVFSKRLPKNGYQFFHYFYQSQTCTHVHLHLYRCGW